MKYTILLLIMICLWACSAPFGKKTKIIHVESFSSKYVPARNIDIWIPASYSADTKYNVLYMHDGQMLFDSTNSWNKQAWMVGETMDRLINEKIIRPTIVVAIWNINELRTIEYFPNKAYQLLSDSIKNNLGKNRLKKSPESDNYLRFITQELKPYIDDTYSTYGDMQHTFIAGSSMGGLISMYAICEYPEIFGGAACLSTHWPGTFESNMEIPAAFRDYLENNLPSADNHKIYFDYGTETLDSLYKPYQMMVDTVMMKKGFTPDNWITKVFAGDAHDERSWAKRLHIPLEFLLK
ncbi:alpha/beta hydrolase [Saccharicrinis sp. 156]|uniref:alpha/beta hydrolase n=1 Tax=Saccharicrinis sp. 156 TaxID=3417574 RepID=UPI003D34F0B1